VEPTLVQKHWFMVGDCNQVEVREVLRMVELMFNKCGGAKKAFLAGTLRREFSKVPGLLKKGKLTKQDLDIIAARFKDAGKPDRTKESMADDGMLADLAVLDWGTMLIQVVVKRYGKDVPMLDIMTKVLIKMTEIYQPKKPKTVPGAIAEGEVLGGDPDEADEAGEDKAEGAEGASKGGKGAEEAKPKSDGSIKKKAGSTKATGKAEGKPAAGASVKAAKTDGGGDGGGGGDAAAAGAGAAGADEDSDEGF